MRQRGRVLWYHHDVIFDRCWIDCFVLWQLTPVSIKTVTFSAADVHLVSAVCCSTAARTLDLGRWSWTLRPTRVYRGANYASLSLCSSGHKSWASVAIIYGILHLDLTLDHNPRRIFCLLSRASASASACISGGIKFPISISEHLSTRCQFSEWNSWFNKCFSIHGVFEVFCTLRYTEVNSVVGHLSQTYLGLVTFWSRWNRLNIR